MKNCEVMLLNVRRYFTNAKKTGTYRLRTMDGVGHFNSKRTILTKNVFNKELQPFSDINRLHEPRYRDKTTIHEGVSIAVIMMWSFKKSTISINHLLR